jgi:hypothetical protein
LLSTDYWETPLAAAGSRRIKAFGRQWRPFDEPSLSHMLRVARASGLVPIGGPDLAGAERVVAWRKRAYTFVFLVMRRVAHGIP